MQSFDIVVRQAKEADFPRIVESCGGNESNPFNQFSSIERIRKLPSQGLLVANVNEIFAGFLYWIVLDKQRGGETKKNAYIVRYIGFDWHQISKIANVKLFVEDRSFLGKIFSNNNRNIIDLACPWIISEKNSKPSLPVNIKWEKYPANGAFASLGDEVE